MKEVKKLKVTLIIVTIVFAGYVIFSSMGVIYLTDKLVECEEKYQYAINYIDYTIEKQKQEKEEQQSGIFSTIIGALIP